MPFFPNRSRCCSEGLTIPFFSITQHRLAKYLFVDALNACQNKIVAYRLERRDRVVDQDDRIPETGERLVKVGLNPDSAVDGETKSEAQVFAQRSQCVSASEGSCENGCNEPSFSAVGQRSAEHQKRL